MQTTDIILNNIEKGEYDLSNEVSHSLNQPLQSIGIKPGNAAPLGAVPSRHSNQQRTNNNSNNSTSNQSLGRGGQRGRNPPPKQGGCC